MSYPNEIPSLSNECISQLLENQGMILELLANRLEGISSREKETLLKSANANFARLKELALALKARNR